MRNVAGWTGMGLCCLVLAACGVSAVPPSASGGAHRSVPSAASTALGCPPAVRRLGMVAFAARDQLRLVDLATCRARVLARGVDAGVVRFSADGRWLAYSRVVDDDPANPVGLSVVPARGGPPRSPLGRGVIKWAWSPTGDRLYGVTADGALVAATPTGPRRVIAAHLGGGRFAPAGMALAPGGHQAIVNRSQCGPPTVGELETIDLRTGARSVTLRQPGRWFTLAGLSPDGRRVLLWSQDQCSASLAADGMPLETVAVSGGAPILAVRHMLLYPDFLSWCGDGRLIAAAGPDRETNQGSALVRTEPPSSVQRTIAPAHPLSWVSPTCAPTGDLLAAAAGLDEASAEFGREHRSIWLLRPDGSRVRRLTRPPAPGLSDEAPRFSRDGRWILYVRTRPRLPVPAAGPSVSLDTLELTPTAGPRAGRSIAIAVFPSDDISFYDHFSWPGEVAWYEPAPPAREATTPSVLGRAASAAYRTLHLAGFGVSVSGRLSIIPYACEPVVGRQLPVAGRRPRGGVVRLILRRPQCAVASPAVPTGRLPSARVPEFVGGTLLRAERWTERHELLFAAERLPPLADGRARWLLANYRVVRQAPAPGATLRLGVGSHHGRTGSFLPTPLTVRGSD